MKREIYTERKKEKETETEKEREKYSKPTKQREKYKFLERCRFKSAKLKWKTQVQGLTLSLSRFSVNSN